ncbi:hypothetical protein [Symbiopectobacterium sp. RP]|uniref:hypothetical protein n=1 Tax=Symbiopectobacterium sp. RP TaxID=3248553 RepID=UPI003D275AD5
MGRLNRPRPPRCDFLRGYKNKTIANRLKNDYSQCPDMWQKNTANCYQNNVAWL